MSNTSKSKTQIILIAVIALVCVALIGVAVFFALSEGSEKGDTTENGTTEATQNTPTEEPTNLPSDLPTERPTNDKPSNPNGDDPIENLPVQNDNTAEDIFE